MNKSGGQFLYFRDLPDSFQKQAEINGFLIGGLQFDFGVLNFRRQLTLLLFVFLHIKSLLMISVAVSRTSFIRCTQSI